MYSSWCTYKNYEHQELGNIELEITCQYYENKSDKRSCKWEDDLVKDKINSFIDVKCYNKSLLLYLDIVL